MNSYHRHQELLNQVLLYISMNYKSMRLWKNNTGKALSFDLKRVLSYGLKGSADITGITEQGIRIEIEIKTGKSVQSEAQRNFMNMIRSKGGIYIVCRELDYQEVINNVFRI